MKKTSNTKTKKKGLIFNGPNYSVMIKYSKKAEDGKIIKIIPKKNKPFEVSTKDLVELLAQHVNFEVLSPAFIENKQIDMIRVTRNVTLTPNRDIKAGETVHIPFKQMMPIEFAIAEEALGVLLIDDTVKTINKKQFEEAKERVTAGVRAFAEEQYKAMIEKAKNNPNSS
jgi:hypothetical protein